MWLRRFWGLESSGLGLEEALRVVGYLDGGVEEVDEDVDEADTGGAETLGIGGESREVVPPLGNGGGGRRSAGSRVRFRGNDGALATACSVG
jgi:hypothetical protein